MTYQRNETPEPLASGDELKPLPCPFCGGVSISAAEGSTFRYWVASCNECGATAGEVRRQTLGEGTNAEWDIAARAEAVKEWNTRATQADAPEADLTAAYMCGFADGKAKSQADAPEAGQEAAAVQAVGAWQDIATAPEGVLVIVGWRDEEDHENPDRHMFDYLEDGVWANYFSEHEHYSIAGVAHGLSEDAPYTHWMPMGAIPAAPVHDKRCPAALNMSDPCNCGETS